MNEWRELMKQIRDIMKIRDIKNGGCVFENMKGSFNLEIILADQNVTKISIKREFRWFTLNPKFGKNFMRRYSILWF